MSVMKAIDREHWRDEEIMSDPNVFVIRPGAKFDTDLMRHIGQAAVGDLLNDKNIVVRITEEENETPE